ncbi:MAG: glutamine-hydrolyzing GMP synthase [Patescibacteria group bacterium]
MKPIQMLVIDLGSQYSLVIGRALRELGVRSAVLSPKRAAEWLKQHTPKGIILSGSSDSVYNIGSPTPGPDFLRHHAEPILGICYGMQWLAHALGGSVTAHHEDKEYGSTKVMIDSSDPLFLGLREQQIVWASHGDSVSGVPSGFTPIAVSGGDTIAAMANRERKLWGLQFHPEVVQTANGKQMLSNFLFTICQCEPDWKPENILESIQAEVSEALKDASAIIGFSGGVDSTTLAAALAPVLGERLKAVSIDTGALREYDLAEITANAEAAHVKVHIVDAAERFLQAIGDTSDAETKRAHFKRLYGTILEEQADRFGAKFIIQGSLATDFIESGGVGEAELIKSHHNIGLKLRLEELHPFRNLFKYEVRELGRTTALALPLSVTEREPFPGPGLFIRVIGAPPTKERLAIVRWANNEVVKIIRKHNLRDSYSQLVVALGCVNTVGVKGDTRSYKPSIWIRAVETADFMTAEGHQFPPDVRREITSTLTKHPEIVRVMYDETDKPPATTEFE